MYKYGNNKWIFKKYLKTGKYNLRERASETTNKNNNWKGIRVRTDIWIRMCEYHRGKMMEIPVIIRKARE